MRCPRCGFDNPQGMQFCGQCATPLSLRLAIRVGIHTGLVVVGEIGAAGRHEQLALGETPNVAARLEGLAVPGTVAISAVSSQLVQGYFVCDDLGAHTFKGVDTPLQVYRIVGESGAQSRLDVASPRSWSCRPSWARRLWSPGVVRLQKRHTSTPGHENSVGR